MTVAFHLCTVHVYVVLIQLLCSDYGYINNTFPIKLWWNELHVEFGHTNACPIKLKIKHALHTRSIYTEGLRYYPAYNVHVLPTLLHCTLAFAQKKL